MICRLDRRSLGKVGVPQAGTNKIDSKFQDLVRCQILADKGVDDGKLVANSSTNNVRSTSRPPSRISSP